MPFRKVAKYTEKKIKKSERKLSAAKMILCLGGLELGGDKIEVVGGHIIFGGGGERGGG